METRNNRIVCPGDRSARIVAFASLGTLSVTQHLAGVVLERVKGTEPDLVAEETLSLVAAATSRAAGAGLRASPDVAHMVVPVLAELPYAYRDYLVGSAMLESDDPVAGRVAEEVHRRLERRQAFYRIHFPEPCDPNERALASTMELWMGRVSPPGLPDSPSGRLCKLGLVPPLLTHLRIVQAYCRNEVGR